MKLKGLLWTKGVNGLGIKGFHCLPYKKRFEQSANIHDICYDIGGDNADRAFDDRIFLLNMEQQSNTPLQYVTAHIYYIMVRLFGWLFFNYNT